MEKKAKSGILLTLLLIGISSLALNWQPVEARSEKIAIPDNSPAITLASSSIRVSILIGYGNGTASWYDRVELPSGSSVFNATLAVAKVNYTSTEYGVFVHAINNVLGAGAYGWLWWYWNQTIATWSLGPIACDQYVLIQGNIIAWYLEDITTWPPPPPQEPPPPRIWVVDDDGPADFSKIQDAISAADYGDTIYVRAGTYDVENGLRIGNGLKIAGEDAPSTVLDGNPWSTLVYIENVDNVVLSGFTIDGLVWHGDAIDFALGIWIRQCVNFSIHGNIFRSFVGYDSQYMWISDSMNGFVYGNKEAEEVADYGIYVSNCSFCSFYDNDLRVSSHINRVSIDLAGSDNNWFFHNELCRALVSDSFATEWDSNYPSGGNYWEDYSGVDADSDGIGDTPYNIDANNTDRYPLAAPFASFDAGTWNGVSYNIDAVSNSTVTDFAFNADEKLISFNVTGSEGTVGFCRIVIPDSLLGGPYGILTNGSPPLTLNEMSNGTHTFLYFTYAHSVKTVQIIGTTVVPEFPSNIILPLLMILTALAIILAKRRISRNIQAHALDILTLRFNSGLNRTHFSMPTHRICVHRNSIPNPLTN